MKVSFDGRVCFVSCKEKESSVRKGPSGPQALCYTREAIKFERVQGVSLQPTGSGRWQAA
jgi:hypothetical protein